MRHRPGRRVDPRQELAFTNQNVMDLVEALVATPDLRLVKVAAKLSLARGIPDEADLAGLVGLSLYFDDDLGATAREVARLALAIGSHPDGEVRPRLRGALLERLTHRLVEQRAPANTHHERDVELLRAPRSRRSWTNTKEVVVDLPGWEVYECKSDGLPVISDIDELSDIVTTGREEGVTVFSTVVVFGDEATLRSMARAWRLTEPIYAVTTTNLLDLRRHRPTVALRA